MNKIIKNIFFIIIFCYTSTAINSDNLQNVSEIFEKYRDAVVYIDQVFYLDSKLIENIKLFQKLEKEYNIKILDSYFIIGSGSGFLITPDGYFITNYHVIDNSKNEEDKTSILKYIDREFLSKISTDFLTFNQYQNVYEDFKTLIKNAKSSYRIYVKHKFIYNVKLIDCEKRLDLALLKADEKNFNYIPIGNSDTLKVGNPVISIGYPLPFEIYKITKNIDIRPFLEIKEIQSSMTAGTISSIRTENWAIQHTASINPGNSGGPLINSDAEVVGVNVGLIKGANDIYFSIAINNLKNWLSDINYGSLLLKNKEINKNITAYKLNENGQIEIGNNIFINYEPGHNIYFNGKKTGITPMLIENLYPGDLLINIDISSDIEYIEQKFLVKNEIKEAFSYNPVPQKYRINLFINSSPSQAQVYINNEIKGTTPILINNIEAGNNEIKLILEGYPIIRDKIYIPKNDLYKKDYSFKKGYNVVFLNPLPEDCYITYKRDDNNFTNKSNEKVYLESGDWKLQINGDTINSDTIKITINDEDIKLNYMPNYITSKLLIRGLKKAYKVYFDGIEITPIKSNNIYEVRIGKHKLEIKRDKNIILEKSIEVQRDETFEIDLRI